MVRRISAAILSAVACCASATAQETESGVPQRYPWTHHRFDAIDYTVTGVAAAGFLYVQLGVDAPREAKWTSTTGADDKVRDWLRAGSVEGRERADKVSDILWYAPMTLPYLELAFPLLGDDWNVDTAWQMTAINFEAFALSGFVTRTGHRFAARQRPDVAPCRQDPDYNGELCFVGSYASYPSGHTSTASVGAGLVCAHHIGLGLLGNDVADGLACGTAVSMALGAGVARIIADRHYVTDVVSGAAIGFSAGMLLPLLRHYREPARASKDAALVRWTVVPSAQGFDGLGLAAFGQF